MAVEPIAFDEPLIFIGGSKVNWAHLGAQEQFPIIAVDGGANDLERRGLRAKFLCGDFDSISSEARSAAEDAGTKIISLPDQNHTDFSKALDQFKSPVIYAYGFLDGRLDHSLDALAQISKRETRRIYLIGLDDVAFVFPPKGEMTIAKGTRISFWSAGHSQIVQSTGLEWALDGMDIDASGMSISNTVAGDGVMVDYVGDPLLAIIPVEAWKA